MRDYPKSVNLGHTEMELQGVRQGVAYYWRERGAWGTNAKWVGDKLMTYQAPMTHLKDKEFTLTEGPMRLDQFESEVAKSIERAKRERGIEWCPNSEQFGYTDRKRISKQNCTQCAMLGECGEARDYFLKKKREENKTDNVLSNNRRNETMESRRTESYVSVDENDGKLMKAAKGIMENGTVAVKNAKDIVVMAQVGSATLESVKTALLAMPIPKQIKDVLVLEGYGDAILGIALDTIVPTLTQNEQARTAAQYASNMGVIRGSEQFTMVQEMIKMVLESAISAGAGILGAVMPEDQVDLGAKECTDEGDRAE